MQICDKEKETFWDFQGSQSLKPSAERTYDLSCISAHFVNIASYACGKPSDRFKYYFYKVKIIRLRILYYIDNTVVNIIQYS